MTHIALPAWLWPVLVAPFIGSFMGVLIRRLPSGAPVVVSRSACPRCGAALRWWELVPLASFVALGGRCGHCRARIDRFHPAVELAAIGVVLWAVVADPAVVDPEMGRLWADCGLGWTLLTLAWIDCGSFVLPDVLTLPLLLSGLALTLVWQPDAVADHCIAAGFGYLSFQAIAFAYRRWRGREGLGGGDAKLVAAAGAWCGIGLLPFIVLGSAFTGLLAALALALTGHSVTSRTRIAFGPCIAVAFWLVWLHGALLGPLMEGP